jgi:hypothetical protein
LEAEALHVVTLGRVATDGGRGGNYDSVAGGAGGTGTTPPGNGAANVTRTCLGPGFCFDVLYGAGSGGGSVGRLALRGVKSCLLGGTLSADTHYECPVGGGAPDGGVSDSGTD